MPATLACRDLAPPVPFLYSVPFQQLVGPWCVCSPSLTALCRPVACLQDVANMFSPSVAARALTMKQALLVAAVFEFTGAVLMVTGGL